MKLLFDRLTSKGSIAKQMKTGPGESTGYTKMSKP